MTGCMTASATAINRTTTTGEFSKTSEKPLRQVAMIPLVGEPIRVAHVERLCRGNAHAPDVAFTKRPSTPLRSSNQQPRLLLHKLGRAIVDPQRDPLEGMIEVDETRIAYRTKDDPVAGGAGRSRDGTLLVAGAVERKDESHPPVGHSRLLSEDAEGVRRGGHQRRFDGAHRRVFVLPGHAGADAPAEDRRRHGGARAAAADPPRFHRSQALGARRPHGVRRAHLRANLDEFVYRLNRRRHYRVAFDTLLGNGLRTTSMTYKRLVFGSFPNRQLSRL